MNTQGSAPGKIILSGEYAVVFGHPGIAVPSPQTLCVSFEERNEGIGTVDWHQIAGNEPWHRYLHAILRQIPIAERGVLHIRNDIPLGKGMGSSTALAIAITRCLLGNDCVREARAIEDAVNPGNSGLDFAVIWNAKPLRFVKGEPPQPVTLPGNLLTDAVLIDTGTPNETTPELVAWVKARRNEPDVARALEIIGNCTERLLQGENPLSVLKEHHRAQVALGVVPEAVQTVMARIEEAGGAAKVIGAGARTGGGGIVLTLGLSEEQIASLTPFPIVRA
jgi:mevalonate kinase